MCPLRSVMCRSDKMVWVDDPTQLTENNEEELIYTDLDSLKEGDEKGKRLSDVTCHYIELI